MGEWGVSVELHFSHTLSLTTRSHDNISKACGGNSAVSLSSVPPAARAK